MPKHPDFQKIYQAFMWRYCKDKTECESGKNYYYAWLNKLGLDDTKAYQRPQESFDWIKPHIQFIKEDENAEYFEIEALFPLSSMNNNVYTKDELIRACRTLIGKPTNLNHTGEVLPEVHTVDADYENDIVGCLDRVEKGSKALQMIKSGEILQVSIEAECLRGTEPSPEGSVCKGQVFTGKAYLTKDVLPGVPLTRIMPVEKLVESFTVTKVTDLNEKGKEQLTTQKEDQQSEKDHEISEPQKPTVTDLRTKAIEVPVSAAKNADVNDYALHVRVQNLESQLSTLKADLACLKKQQEPEPPQKESKTPYECVLTKEGFWARFHKLRSEGASKSEAFRLVSLEVLEAANKKLKT